MGRTPCLQHVRNNVLSVACEYHLAVLSDFATDALAVARLTRLVTEDKITEPARDWIGGRFPESKLAYLVNCPYCSSVWAAALVVTAPRPTRPILRMLALSETAILLKGLTDV